MLARLTALYLLLPVAGVAFAQECSLGALADRDVGESWNFSEGLALRNDRLAVGAPNAPSPVLGSTSQGLVRLYQRDGRNFFVEEEIGYPGIDFGPDFGLAIALHDDLLVVGAPLEDLSGVGTNEGAIFVYELLTKSWTLVATLTAADPQVGARFGDDVETDGVTIVVGARIIPSSSGGSSSQGAAYVFRKSGGVWTQTQKLVASDRANGAEFGAALHVEGAEILVGAPGRGVPSGEHGVGAVYRFLDDGSAYSEVRRIDGLVTDCQDDFGRSLDVCGDRMVVGAPRWGPGISSRQGACFAYTFDGTDWIETEMLPPPGGVLGTSFGASVATDGSVVIVGAPFGDLQPGDDAGLVHIYRLDSGGLLALDTSLSADPTSDTGLYGSDLALSSGILAGGAYNGSSSCLEEGGRVELTSVDGAICRSLTSFPSFHSLANGGTTIFTLDAGPEHAGDIYFLGGSLSGTNPGAFFSGMRLPLNVDDWFQFAIISANAGVWSGNSGVLDGNGRGVVLLNLPSLNFPSLAGTVLDHAFVTFAADGSISDVSNPAPLCLLP